MTSPDGTTIAFDRAAERPPVILVGGAFQHRAFDPRTGELAGRLAVHFAVFNDDRRGGGDSGDTPQYAAERELEDLEAVIEQAGGSAFLHGSSSGDNLALTAVLPGLLQPNTSTAARA